MGGNAVMLKTRRQFVLVLTFLVSWNGSAGAEVNAVCGAIAATANGRASEAKEAEMDDLIEEIVGFLPEGTQYLEPHPTQADDLLDLFGCDDALTCQNEQLPDWMFHLGPDSEWGLGLVDTRPWSDVVFVLARNYLGCRRAVALKQNAEHDWSRLALGPTDLASTCSRGTIVLRSGNSPHLVVPEFTSTFARSGDAADGRESRRLALRLLKPTLSIEAAPQGCRVTYIFTPRLGTASPLIAPPAAGESAIRAFLDRHVTAMTVRTAFNEDTGAQITSKDDWVSAGTDAEELKAVRDHLSAAKAQALTDQAMQTLVKAGADKLPEEGQGESRWLAVGFGGRAYAALLAEYEEFAMPVDEWHPLIALFSINNQALEPVAAFLLESSARFERATAGDESVP
jgi:hypothetical protein